MHYRLLNRVEEKGQTLLIVVLVMVVALTVGLSVVLRSITNVRIATEEENSQRAFSAAEAGIEQALKTGQDISPQELDNKAKIQEVKVLQLDGAEFLINSGNPIEKNDAVDVWLVEHNSNGTINYSSGWQSLNNRRLTVYWGTSANPCQNAALEIIVISGAVNAPTVTRYAWDDCADRRAGNNFSDIESGNFSFLSGTKNFFYRQEIALSNGILVRINPLYYRTPLGVRGCAQSVESANASCTSLPSQGKVIESTGISDNTVRKVTFFQGYPKVPAEFFPHGVFMPN